MVKCTLFSRIIAVYFDNYIKTKSKLYGQNTADTNKITETGGTCSAYGGEERRIQGLVGKPEGKRPLGRARRRWEDNIKMDLQEVRRGGVDWIKLAQDRDRWRALVTAVMNLRVLQDAGNFLTG
jgi:hypothetical protein